MSKIKIKLLSDSCIASGETFNSSIDSDVCYDSMGLPYIPAKRIKGCLRESALELRDLGVSEFNVDGKDMINEIFGNEGYKPAVFSLSSAKLVGYEDYVSDLKNADSSYSLQQTVLNQFTYIRYQTKINEATGTADDTSLRAIRVMNKGLEFEADIELPEQYENAISMCCQNFRNMGLNRTRGMGELKVSFEKAAADSMPQSSSVKWDDSKNYSKLEYNITLKSPALFKSVAGGQTKTVEYIDGAKLLGMLAQGLDEDFVGFMEKGKLICSNAYVSDGEKRFTPISASVYHVKNEKNNLRDKAYADSANAGIEQKLQLCQIGGWFVNSDTEEAIVKQTVDTEIHYHHSRPEDKSKGHVVSKGDKAKGSETNSKSGGAFFQMESVSAGQVFSGFIMGSKEQLKKVYDLFTAKPSQRIGYSKLTEYGSATIEITSLEEASVNSQNMKSQFVVKLNAPAIIYNGNGMYSTNESELINCIAEKLGVASDELVILNRFLSYNKVGGFNVTWGYKKPVVNAFDMGTTLVLETKNKQPIDVSPIMHTFVGSRCCEGYGEIVCYDVPTIYEKKVVAPKSDKNEGIHNTNITYKTELISDIASAKAKEYIKRCAREEAERASERGVDKGCNAVNSNLIMMCKEQPTFDAFRRNIKERFDKKTDVKNVKLENANKIITKELDMEQIMKAAIREFPLAKLEINEVYKLYVMTLLVTIKYKIKEEKSNE